MVQTAYLRPTSSQRCHDRSRHFPLAAGSSLLSECSCLSPIQGRIIGRIEGFASLRDDISPANRTADKVPKDAPPCTRRERAAKKPPEFEGCRMRIHGHNLPNPFSVIISQTESSPQKEAGASKSPPNVECD